MSELTHWMDESWYPEFESNWDDRTFRETIEKFLKPDAQLLDLGAGAGIIPAMNFRGRAARVCGVDPSPRVRENPYLDEARQGVGEEIPYPDASFDLVISDNVLEHLADPEAVLREVHRVLRPGGHFLAKTPNRRHYVAWLARITPHWFHQRVNARRGRASADTFPTLYRANTPDRIRALAARTGFALQDCQLIEGRPEYLRISPLTYALGRLYERIVNASPWLARFRVVIIAVLRKQEHAGDHEPAPGSLPSSARCPGEIAP